MIANITNISYIGIIFDITHESTKNQLKGNLKRSHLNQVKSIRVITVNS